MRGRRRRRRRRRRGIGGDGFWTSGAGKIRRCDPLLSARYREARSFVGKCERYAVHAGIAHAARPWIYVGPAHEILQRGAKRARLINRFGTSQRNAAVPIRRLRIRDGNKRYEEHRA